MSATLDLDDELEAIRMHSLHIGGGELPAMPPAMPTGVGRSGAAAGLVSGGG